ncbi:MAG: septum formation inhibitor Maf [Oscillibacter sp.]|nr:septum formation inhibitor Maf [Oscillibacter sp.]
MPRMILASQSPRRRQLLEQIGVKNFDILVPQADETYDPDLSPEEIVSSICRKKAEAARALAGDPDAIIITADTMVFLGDLRLGKPRDQVDAFTMLSALSGHTHQVRTGVTVSRGERMETRTETTAVTFRPLTQDEIWGYIRSGEPMDKAGAYGAQGKAALFVSRIEGDYFNVMGLPLFLLGGMLSDFGVKLFSEEELH